MSLEWSVASWEAIRGEDDVVQEPKENARRAAEQLGTCEVQVAAEHAFWEARDSLAAEIGEDVDDEHLSSSSSAAAAHILPASARCVRARAQ